MQEEVENRTVNLAISTTKLTGRTIIAGIRKYLQHREKVKMKKARDPAVHGKQSVKQLLGQNQGATNVEIDKESIRDFEKLAKKYGVDFAVRKDKSVDPPRFLVFVRSKDADALDAICKEHQARAFHLLLKEEQTATYSVEIWKRFRKWGGLPTGITQNVKDLLRSPEIANILENSDFIYMLNQASDDRSILAQRLNISPHQLSYVTNSGEGEGLLFYGNVILPFIDRFPTDLELYRIMTTKLNEVAQEKEA